MLDYCMLVVLATAALVQGSTALTYQYFAMGSNVQPTTMTSLRNLSPLNATAAVLPGYRLAFNIPGLSMVEPSAASVARSEEPEDCVHGALYLLTQSDFIRLSLSEGVPFVYRWEKVRVYPYVGDGAAAGATAVKRNERAQDALTLVAQRPHPADIPPSGSYLGIIQKGARYWNMDLSYQRHLAELSTSQAMLGRGVSGIILRTAELLNPRSLY